MHVPPDGPDWSSLRLSQPRHPHPFAPQRRYRLTEVAALRQLSLLDLDDSALP